MPNAGLPATVEGRNIYLCSPEYMAQYARRFLMAGVRIVGGCCGTTPEHIKEIRNEARSLQHIERSHAIVSELRVAAEGARKDSGRRKRACWARNSPRKRFVAFVEILPPRGVDASKEIEGAKLCKAAGIDCINVPDGPRASARMSAQVTCQLIQQQAEIEAVLHFCCRDRNILSIQSELLGAYTIGVQQSDLHHRRSAAHGHLSRRDGGVRRRCHRADEHREQSESRPGPRRQSDGIANRAADRRRRESRRAESWTRSCGASSGKSKPARNTSSRSRSSISTCSKRFCGAPSNTGFR